MATLFILSSACIQVITDSDGKALISIKVPGTFGKDSTDISVPAPFEGYAAPFPTGRYLEKCEVWTNTHDVGDRLASMSAKDLDGVIPVPMRALFPKYPIISSFCDQDIIEENGFQKGLFLNPSKPLLLKGLDGMPNFIPGGLYLVGEFQSAVAAAGKILMCNFHWRKKI